MQRRDFVRMCVNAGAALAAPMLNFGVCRLGAATSRKYSIRTVDLVGSSLVIDMLGLLTLDWSRLRRWHSDPSSLTPADLERITGSGINVFHPAVDLNCEDPYQQGRALFESWNGFLAARSADFQRIGGCHDLDDARAHSRIGILLGMQNSDHFRTPDDVAEFYRLGQRVSQLTYNAPNRIGYGCIERLDRGLTPFGVSIVEAMNQSRMVIDVSHAGERTTLETFQASSKPVLITHSNCQGLVRHPRCKSDNVIRAMAKKGGVMGITSIRTFVRQSDRATVEDALDHFTYVARLVGVEHVGIGSDLDLEGRPVYGVRGLNHSRRTFDITEGLVRRRFSNEAIRLILGGNFRRALSEIC